MMSIEHDDELVLVTGASGYIATHIVKQLLDAGYRVRGTVRSIKDEKKCAPLRKLSENSKHKLELCEANLLKQDGWSDAVDGCSYVLHTASPFPLKVPKHESELTEPAVNGTLYVLRACSEENSTVKRVVLTSSTAAIYGDVFKDGQNFNEADWPDEYSLQAYEKSKMLAEKAAWDYIEDMKMNGKECFELAVINPGLVLGPFIHDSECASMTTILNMAKGRMPALPKLCLPICDVRDVAQAHVKAMKQADCAYHRHIIVSQRESVSMKEIAKILKTECQLKSYKISTIEAPSVIFKTFSRFSPSLKMIAPLLDKRIYFDNSRMINVLHIQPIDLKQSLIDMINSLKERGFL